MTSSRSASTLPQLSDFPDWLPALVVKEMRQGLRSGVFTVALILAHVAAALLWGWELFRPAASTGSGGIISPPSVFRGFFYFVLGGIFLFVLPLSAWNALGDEGEHGKAELLRASGMTEARLVTAKWLSRTAQGLLIFISLVPHLIAQYFLLQAEPVELMITTLVVMTLHALANAIVIGASACSSLGWKVWMLGLQAFSAWICLVGTMAATGGVLYGVLRNEFAAGAVVACTGVAVAASFMALGIRYGAWLLEHPRHSFSRDGASPFGVLIGVMGLMYLAGGAMTLGFGLLPLAVVLAVWISRMKV